MSQRESLAPAPRGGARVFVVDDSEESLFLVETILDRAGYAVSTIRDGNQLFARAFQERPDLILCDLSMPGVDGAVLTKLLKRVHGTQVRVLLYSGLEENQLAARAVECGADGHVSKRSTPTGLLARVREALEKRVTA